MMNNKKEFKENIIKDSNEFIRIDFFDDKFSKNILEATNRIVSELMYKNNNETLYKVVKEDIENNGLENFKNRIVYSTYLLNCLDEAVYPYVLNHFTLEKSSSVLDYLNRNINISFENKQLTLNNSSKTCYIDLVLENVFIV